MWTMSSLAAWTPILGTGSRVFSQLPPHFLCQRQQKWWRYASSPPLPLSTPFNGSPSPQEKPPRPIPEQARHLIDRLCPFQPCLCRSRGPCFAPHSPRPSPHRWFATYPGRARPPWLLHAMPSSGECLHAHLLSGKSPPNARKPFLITPF